MTDLTTLQLYRSLLPSVFVPSFLMSVCQSSVLLMIPLFALDLGESLGSAALVFSLRGLGNMIADVPAGYIVARLGDKPAMLIGVGIMLVTGLAAGFATEGWHLGVAALLFGSAMATWLVARLALISDTIPTAQRGKAIATMAGLQRFGALAGPVASGFIALNSGYGAVFLAVALIAALSGLLVLVYVPRKSRGAARSHMSLLHLIPRILREHRAVFMTAGLAISLLTMVRSARQLLVPVWGSSIGLNAAEIGLITGAAAAVDMSMFPLAGYLMDHRGRKYAALSSVLVLALGMLLMPAADSLLILTLCAMVLGLGNGLGSGINMTLGSDLAPSGQRGEFLGVWRLMGDSGSFVGPVAIGQLAAASSLSAVFFMLALMGVASAAIFARFVRETLPGADDVTRRPD